MGELAVAYNNTEQYEKALEILEERMDRNRENYEWYYRLGFALYYCAEQEEDVKSGDIEPACGRRVPMRPGIETFPCVQGGM